MMPNETRIIPAWLLHRTVQRVSDRERDEMRELLEKSPCPFCGGEPKGYPYGWYVECENCHIRINGISYENAVERWNTRYEPTCKWETTRDGSSIRVTECGQSYDWYPLDLPKHCPNCGAKVIEE